METLGFRSRIGKPNFNSSGVWLGLDALSYSWFSIIFPKGLYSTLINIDYFDQVDVGSDSKLLPIWNLSTWISSIVILDACFHSMGMPTRGISICEIIGSMGATLTCEIIGFHLTLCLYLSPTWRDYF